MEKWTRNYLITLATVLFVVFLALCLSHLADGEVAMRSAALGSLATLVGVGGAAAVHNRQVGVLPSEHWSAWIYQPAGTRTAGLRRSSLKRAPHAADLDTRDLDHRAAIQDNHFPNGTVSDLALGVAQHLATHPNGLAPGGIVIGEFHWLWIRLYGRAEHVGRHLVAPVQPCGWKRWR